MFNNYDEFAITAIFFIALYHVFMKKIKIDGVVHKSYGLFTKNKPRDANIVYELNWWDVVICIISIYTIIIPLYIIGWEIMAPVSKLPEAAKE